MQKLFTVGVAVALVASVACGKSEAERQAEQAAAEAQKAADAATKAAEAAGQDVAKGMEEFGKAMAGLAGAMGGDGKTVEPVSFQALQGTLPQVAGWEMGKPEGERMTAPFPFSSTEATYTKGDASLEVKVVDSGFAQMLIAPWSMMLASGYSRETSDGYEKAVTVNGQPGFEKWDSSSKSGELNVLVDKRFLVTVEGRDLSDTKVLHEMAGKMDFGKFAALK
ncbi:MAG: hypothetical protein IT179_22270 [Acidobacteria bacterium]|nr:hypothetical protein [Acidobacteriota bacterium]